MEPEYFISKVIIRLKNASNKTLFGQKTQIDIEILVDMCYASGKRGKMHGAYNIKTVNKMEK